MSIEQSPLAQEPRLQPGLYIVATPIGNLGDITFRAAAVLRAVDVVAAEDTRVTAKLLQRIGSTAPMTPYHDHSSDAVRERLVERARRHSVALVSDAGTPLISDPGYKLVRAARAAGVAVTTLPGPCAAVAALTLAGLPTDRFLFAGFLPPKEKALADAIAVLAPVDVTLVFYETGRRLGRVLAALRDGLGDRPAAVARELTKTFEEVAAATLGELATRYAATAPKGEIVIVVGAPARPPPADAGTLDAALAAALAAQPLKTAVAEVAARLGLPRKTVYARALELRDAG